MGRITGEGRAEILRAWGPGMMDGLWVDGFVKVVGVCGYCFVFSPLQYREES